MTRNNPKRNLSRRRFLRQGLAGFSLAATAPHFLGVSSSAFAGDGDDDRILVVVQLSGGNDGLSTIVPYGDPAYNNARRNSLIRENELFKIDKQLGFHPGLERFSDIYKDGKLAIVQGASYPNPNRSHFRSMDVWHTGDLRGRG